MGRSYLIYIKNWIKLLQILFYSHQRIVGFLTKNLVSGKQADYLSSLRRLLTFNNWDSFLFFSIFGWWQVFNMDFWSMNNTKRNTFQIHYLFSDRVFWKLRIITEVTESMSGIYAIHFWRSGSERERWLHPNLCVTGGWVFFFIWSWATLTLQK